MKKIALIWSHHLHIQWKFKLLAGKFTCGNKAKHCWVISTHFWKQKVIQQCFEFLLKVKVMGSNQGYLLKSFLLYFESYFRLEKKRGRRWTNFWEQFLPRYSKKTTQFFDAETIHHILDISTCDSWIFTFLNRNY